jgi:hypothetical protein
MRQLATLAALAAAGCIRCRCLGPAAALRSPGQPSCCGLGWTCLAGRGASLREAA